MPDHDDTRLVQDIVALHRDAHDMLRAAIAGLDSATLGWVPGPEQSAIGMIITHACGAEAEMLRNVLGIPTDRDRPAEFAGGPYTPAGLLALLDAADADWAILAPRIDSATLRADHSRPRKPAPQSGLYWIMRNYGHLREHVGEIGLTRQLYARHAA